MDLYIPIEIVNIIFNYSEFLSQIRLTQISKYYNEKLQVVDFYNMDERYISKLTNKILVRYPNIKKLNVSNNLQVTNINHLEYLEELNASGMNCGVSDYMMRFLDNIKILNVSNNPKVTHIWHMKNLEKLNASGSNCGIDDVSISDLNLKVLIAFNNPNITNVNHMDKLEELNAMGNCGIDSNGIAKLNLKILLCWGNKKIKSINHMCNLEFTDIDIKYHSLPQSVYSGGPLVVNF